jgi:5'(3')-deoxyribonucleotidase
MCIADTYTPLVEELCNRYGLDLDPTKYTEYFGDHTTKHPEIERHMIDEIFSTDDFFLHLPVLRGAQTAVKRLERNFDVYILTRPWLQAEHPFMDKYNWLGKYFPKYADKIIATSQKQIVYGDILIDDHMPFCTKWKSFWCGKKMKPIVASLKYPWTDSKIVDIIGNNWTDLVNQIERKFFK